eukprot:COSAG02_NODE_17190_length_1022_cov_1.781148_1_plen_274_part_10
MGVPHVARVTSMPVRSGPSHPLGYEPDAAALRRQLEGLENSLRRRPRRKAKETPSPAPPLRVTIRAAEKLPLPTDRAGGEVIMQPDGTARLQYESASPQLPRSLFQDCAFALLVDTHSTLAPVCTAALHHGAASVRAYRSGNDILDLRASPQPALMGPRLWGGSRTDSDLLEDDDTIVGGVLFERESEREIQALQAEAAKAAEEVEEAKVAGLNTTLRNPLHQQNTTIHVGVLRRAEQRLAAINDQLSRAVDVDSRSTVHRGELTERRAIESSM